MAEGIKKPVFIGQALLLLAPVAVLLVIGLNSLRQDKLQAHREAAERAQQLADSLAAREVALFAPAKPEPRPGTRYVFQVDASGQLLFPPQIGPLTPKPLLTAGLTREQAESWRSAQKAEAQSNGVAQASAAYTSFLALNPPAGFAANAYYSLGLLQVARGNFAEAANAFRKLAEGHPDALTESGLALKPLAALKLLELRNRVPDIGNAVSLESVCSNLVYEPNPLTRALLRQAGQFARAGGDDSVVKRWMELWTEHERIRGLHALAALHFGNRGSKAVASAWAGAFWFHDDAGDAKGRPGAAPAGPKPEDWLAVHYEQSSTGLWFACYSEGQARTLARTVMDQAGTLANYLSAELSLAGKIMIPSPDENQTATKAPADKGKELLAFAARPETGKPWMEAKVYLAEPAILYRHQRARRFWFGALIACCAVAALVGLVANWRAFKRQQRLSELKSNFVSSVSHELRTPVASVRLLVEGLESGRVSGAAKQKEYLHLMGQECRRLSGLIDNILDFSRIDDGRKQFEFSPTDVEALAAETLKMLEPYAAARKVSLALKAAGKAPPKPETPSLDGLALRQALLNLLDNAIKHSPEGSIVTVGVEWPRLDNGGSRCVWLWVEDSGAGIPKEDHEKIFERFYRRGSELNRETQGIGIGLTIVRHIVEAHEGRVLVRSAPGQGSRFTMELPLERKQETTA